jgi:hypothetical protein
MVLFVIVSFLLVGAGFYGLNELDKYTCVSGYRLKERIIKLEERITLLEDNK